MNKHVFIAILLSATTLYMSAQNKQEKAAILSAIDIKRDALENFYKDELGDSIAAMFSPNCHLVTEFSEIIESQEDVARFYKDEYKSGKRISAFKLKPLEKKVYDDIVLEIGTNKIEYTMLPDKKLHIKEMNYMFVWKKSKKKGYYHLRAAMWNLPEDPCK